MSDTVISIEEVSKMYRLGEVGTGTLSHDLNRWWANVRGKEDPYLKLGEENKRASKGGNYAWALKDINFEVKQGEVLGVIGKNGAGKSTLLKLLSRVTAPTKGVIKAKGRIASLLEVGTGFHPELTGRDNIYLNGAILGMSKAEIRRKFDEIVAFAGVERYIDTPVKRYSSGMYVRLAFAVAAYLEPEILILDEVLAVGDVEFQKKCLGKIKDVSDNEGRTVLFVSHNMASIETLTTRAVLLQYGQVDFIGTPRKAIDKYFEKLATDAENQLEQRIDATGDKAIVFKRAWVENAYRKPAEEVMCGEDIYLCVEYKVNEAQNMDNIHLALAIYQQNETKITDIWNRSVNFHINLKDKSSGIIRCKISALPLNAGTYYFNIFCKSYNQLRFAVERACNFYVIPGDFYNTGVLLNESAGIMFVNQHWSVE